MSEYHLTRWMNIKQLAAYLGYSSPTTVRQKVKDGLLPKPSKHLGKDSPRWDKVEIDKAMGAKVLTPLVLVDQSDQTTTVSA